MDERYAKLGLTTVAQRLAFAAGSTPPAGASAEASAMAAAMRRITEQAAGGLGLDADFIHLAAEIAALEPDLDYDRRFALIILIAASLAALMEGSTRLPVAGPHARSALERLLAPMAAAALGPERVDHVIGRIERMLSERAAPHVIGFEPDDFRPLVYRAPHLYHQRILAAERRAAVLLAERLREPPIGPLMEPPLREALADLRNRPSRLHSRPDGSPGQALELSGEQLAAVAAAARFRLALISGGPGTGKTSIVVAILRLLTRMGISPEEIALAAPTGKAAYRMGESIREGLARIDNPSGNDRDLAAHCPPPATIHRLIGYSPGTGRFRHHRGNPLSAAAVVIDESSMLDLSLMEQLLAAVAPTARLVMLGDADQLPSVAAGAIFRDLVATAAGIQTREFCTRLTRSYRIASGEPAGESIGALAQAINSGAEFADRTMYERRASAAELRFSGAEFLCRPDGDLEEFLDRWFGERARTADCEQLAGEVYSETAEGFESSARARIERLFDLTAGSRVLCLTRTFSTGADRVNASLHRRVAEAGADGVSWRSFAPGEPVMVIRNDYERMLFNGDQGVVLRVRRPGARPALMAVFRRREELAAFHLEALRDLLELCYATTVHKAQGSEFETTAVLLPEQPIPLLTREVLYTAVTRSQRSVVMVGDERMFAAGAGRGLERYTGLGDELVRLLSQAGNTQ